MYKESSFYLRLGQQEFQFHIPRKVSASSIPYHFIQMGFRKRKLSDPTYVESTSSKRRRSQHLTSGKVLQLDEPDTNELSLFEATASLPSSPTQPLPDDLEGPTTPPAKSIPLPLFPTPRPPASPVAAMTSDPSLDLPLSPMLVSPVKPRGVGRPQKSPRRISRTRSAWSIMRSQKLEASMELSAQRKIRTKQMDKVRLAAREAKRIERKERAYNVIRHITSSDGANFRSLGEFFEALTDSDTPSDQQVEAKLTRFSQSKGCDLTRFVWKRAPEVADVILSEEIQRVLAKEGQAIQELLTRENSTKMSDLLIQFSISTLIESLKKEAPVLWESLEAIATNSGRRTEETQRDMELVLATTCAMLAVLRSQRANNFQAVIGMFLIASGTSKRTMEVFHHAGISLSYPATIKHMKTLSNEAVQRYQRIVQEQMCSLVWDNLCIQFRVGSQRLDSKDHFDNGTTATLIPIFNPYTKSCQTPHGTLPLSMKPARNTTNPIFDFTNDAILPSPDVIQGITQCCKWQLRRIATDIIPGLAHLKSSFGSCPEVDKIELHKTEQYPLPAMKEEENSIDGTIRVFETILRNAKVSNDDLIAHGIMFTDGDLLTDSLVDKVESARRNNPLPINGMKGNLRRLGIWHAKASGCRMIINEHWGQPQSKDAGAAAHISDGFRLFCGIEDLDQWARSASSDDFIHVSDLVYENLFTTRSFDAAKSSENQDTTYLNNLLQNRDTLLYIEIVDAIKSGDIGRVVNVFRVWMVMMRAKKTMPKYADAFFETLGRLNTYPETLKKFYLHNWLVNVTGKEKRWKEVDLLQEHQNFWAKIIYNAKGSNRSWDWLAMITPIIFELRNAIRMVQTEFKIVDLSTKHTVPDMTREIAALADALKEEKIQSYVANRLTNGMKKLVRDLFEEGSKIGD
ncbi:hypothetical protein C8R42DRAFT_742175 [Lentinula raphanica]|nr:hypothetical protein C8R42DRAFT_742175 [Lentinula raphanica]